MRGESTLRRFLRGPVWLVPALLLGGCAGPAGETTEGPVRFEEGGGASFRPSHLAGSSESNDEPVSVPLPEGGASLYGEEGAPSLVRALAASGLGAIGDLEWRSALDRLRADAPYFAMTEAIRRAFRYL